MKGFKTSWSPDERRAKGIINLLQTIEPEGIMAVTGEGEWELLEFAVDSGAMETVVPPDVLHCINLMQGAANKRGVEYEVANGEKIQNLEEEKFVGTSEEGTERNMTAQVCDINKALLSVKRVVKAGNRVVFDEDGSYIEDKQTGEKMWMEENNGMYILKLWVRAKSGF